MLIARSDTSVDLQFNAKWTVLFDVLDEDGYRVETTPVITVTDSAGTDTNPSFDRTNDGLYRVTVSATPVGRSIMIARSLSYGACSFVAYISAVTPASGFVTLSDVQAYLGTDDSTDPAIVQDALDAESAAQRRRCEIGATYPADLAQALKRRVARNLAMRGHPLATFSGDSAQGDPGLILPGNDPEVRRLEAPYRKLVQP